MCPVHVLKVLQFLHAQIQCVIGLLDLLLLQLISNYNMINIFSHCLREQMCKTPWCEHCSFASNCFFLLMKLFCIWWAVAIYANMKIKWSLSALHCNKLNSVRTWAFCMWYNWNITSNMLKDFQSDNFFQKMWFINV